jgi:5-methylcytosine-specific restriction endonuclease McrA
VDNAVCRRNIYQTSLRDCGQMSRKLPERQMFERTGNRPRREKTNSWQERRLRRARLHQLGLRMDEYEEKYLKSSHWTEFRKRALQAQKENLGYNCCERCGERIGSAHLFNLHVHHLTYERLGNELIEDVEIICRKCHEKEHLRDKLSLRRHYSPDRFAGE